ncbi:hypothetical protein [Pseudopedobacter beijingensis]|uniref:Uncharacterized protein n=1 Tax=Pseudopedobacter beijingensis TaxID=1207056 RepID=A0ABW4IF05_9SPHI
MKNKLEEDIIIEKSFYQAKNLLEEFGEFYPFAMGIDKKKQIFNINTFSGTEKPNPLSHKEELIEALNVSIKDNELIAVTVVVNVMIVPPYDEVKLSAIEIEINNSFKDSVNYYIPYEDKEGSIEYYELFKLEGTLRIW